MLLEFRGTFSSCLRTVYTLCERFSYKNESVEDRAHPKILHDNARTHVHLNVNEYIKNEGIPYIRQITKPFEISF